MLKLFKINLKKKPLKTQELPSKEETFQEKMDRLYPKLDYSEIPHMETTKVGDFIDSIIKNRFIPLN